MNTEEFFAAVLPSAGPYRLQYAIPNKKGLRTHSGNTITEIAKEALELDAKGYTVYYRSASFDDETCPQSIEFAAQRRSFHVDVDVKEKKGYPDRHTAAKELSRVVKELNLPMPLMVLSGVGFHVYWPLTEEVDVPKWQPVANELKKKLKNAGLKFDIGLASNAVCLLRPIGTHHRKTDTPLPVKQLPTKYTPTPFNDFKELICGSHDELPEMSSAAAAMFGPATDLVVAYESRPSDAETVARDCAFIRRFKNDGFDGGGLQAEWYYAMGAIKHCTDGEAKCHEFSSNASNYDEGVTQEKLDDWGDRGAASCEYVSDNFDYCTSCPHKGQIAYPLQLGIAEGEKQEIAEALEESEGGPWWPSGAGWDDTKKEMFVKVWDTDEGKWERVHFSRTKFYVSTRINTDEGWMFQMHRRKYLNDDGSEVWDDFTVPTSHVARPTDLATELAKKEIYMTDKKGSLLTAKLLSNYGDALREQQIESELHAVMGWYCSDLEVERSDMSYAAHADGFVVGNKMITADGEAKVLLSDDIRDNWRGGFGMSGTPREWAKGIHEYFVKTEAIPFQFIILTEFASSLVQLFGKSEYHGNLVSLVSESGGGKTTACKAGMTLWGNPDNLYLNGNPSAGITTKAFQKSLSSLNNIGVLLDEVGKQQASVLGEITHVVSMGKPRDRLGIGGKPLPTDDPWFSITKVTSNKPVMQIVAEDDNDTEASGDAIQKRVFEINFDRLGYAKDEFTKDEALGDKVQKFIDSQYGTACYVWIRYLLNNKDDAIALLNDNYRKVKSHSYDSSERFLDYLEAAVLTAVQLSKQANLMFADAAKIRKFIHEVRDDMKALRADTKVPMVDAFSRYLAQNLGGLLHTKKFPIGKGRSEVTEVPSDLRGELIGRIASQDHFVVLAVSPLKDWCRQKGVDFHRMISELDKQGYFTHDTDKLQHNNGKPEPMKTAADRFSLGRGTSVASARTNCLVMDYSRIASKTTLRGVANNSAVAKA